jgi:hypothetical protein
MNISAKLYPLIDKVYDRFTIKRKCSVVLENDLFDGRQYSIDEFYNYVQPFFNKPELFYTKLSSPCEKDILKLYVTEKNETFFTYPSPAITKWKENNKAFFKLFSNNNNADTLLFFAPGWARKNLEAESQFCHQLLKNLSALIFFLR